ncbi:cysteine desulfurase family protein [Tessaracoccus sp. ZS01]|uniref:cysteine desulfurase family protein n=1 Tax=Tessaracoccus sp. ZS01 TaxID=1906324 RepID=UPI00096E6C06|nr:cysteine desulfurase family protein [Tessaracoccus sp. ZS01]MCG6566347.1 cysteine desulfurase [Tessaracoccus sp. ZS01]OMG58815.1 class V aminotransferase [Tessaracoccus sp. ZS01]
MSVYLDHAASSPMRGDSITVFTELASLVGNPSSLHRPGQRARAILEEAREELAVAVGAHPTEVVFTSGGSEADSIAVLGGWAKRRDEGRDRCLVSAVEHPAVLGAVQWGAETIPVTSEGWVDVAEAAHLIDERAGVVSVMAANNETGIVQPVDDIRGLAERVGAWLHVDAVQALGHLPVDFAASGADLMSLSAHKIGGPVGIGALLARREVVPRATGLGGGQEREVRSGTVPVILAAAFARAASTAVGSLPVEAGRLCGLSRRIAAAAVGAGGRLNSRDDGAPHIVNVTFDGIRADDLLFLLDQRGVHASVGSACRAGVHQPSDVLLAMGRTPDEATQSLRFSVGWSTTDADIDGLCQVLPEALQQARAAF